jgi:hypothetical protein
VGGSDQFIGHGQRGRAHGRDEPRERDPSVPARALGRLRLDRRRQRERTVAGRLGPRTLVFARRLRAVLRRRRGRRRRRRGGLRRGDAAHGVEVAAAGEAGELQCDALDGQRVARGERRGERRWQMLVVGAGAGVGRRRCGCEMEWDRSWSGICRCG